MRNTGASASQEFNINLRRPDTVSDNEPRTEKAYVVHVLDERLIQKDKTIGFLENGLQGVNMDWYAQAIRRLPNIEE
jgi:hypothetical protein